MQSFIDRLRIHAHTESTLGLGSSESNDFCLYNLPRKSDIRGHMFRWLISTWISPSSVEVKRQFLKLVLKNCREREINKVCLKTYADEPCLANQFYALRSAEFLFK